MNNVKCWMKREKVYRKSWKLNKKENLSGKVTTKKKLKTEWKGKKILKDKNWAREIWMKRKKVYQK